MQDQQILSHGGRDGVGTTLIVTELNEQSPVVQLLKDRADLPEAAYLRNDCSLGR